MARRDARRAVRHAFLAQSAARAVEAREIPVRAGGKAFAAGSARGQAARFSTWRQGFDSPTRYASTCGCSAAEAHHPAKVEASVRSRPAARTFPSRLTGRTRDSESRG